VNLKPGWLAKEFERVRDEVESGSDLLRQGAREALEFSKQKNREYDESFDLAEPRMRHPGAAEEGAQF
jgi:hypothetical protein